MFAFSVCLFCALTPELESSSDSASDAKSIEAQFEQMFDRVKGVRAQAVRADINYVCLFRTHHGEYVWYFLVFFTLFVRLKSMMIAEKPARR
jgi:hypothetical protein